MTVGLFLDRAAAELRAARRSLERRAGRDAYEMAGYVAGREHVYRELARVLAVVRDCPPATAVTSDAVVVELGGALGASIDPGLLLATALANARLGQPTVPPTLLTVRRNAAAHLVKAADAAGMAAEILATHLGAGVLGIGSERFPTPEGHALATGAERNELLGEVARLTLRAVGLDRTMLDPPPASRSLAARGGVQLAGGGVTLPGREFIQQWVNSAFPAAVDRLAKAKPAVLARSLGAAPVVERSIGPRITRSWQDALDAVAVARTIVHRQPLQATIPLAAATARLGFAVNAIAEGFRDPAGQFGHATRLAEPWYQLLNSLRDLADIRSGTPQPIITELDSASCWLRTHVASDADPQAMHAPMVEALQRQVRHLCRELGGPLHLATTHGRLLSATHGLDSTARRGVRVAVTTWETARPDDPQVTGLLQHISMATKGPVDSRTPAPAHVAATSFPVRPTSQPTGSPDAPGRPPVSGPSRTVKPARRSSRH